jgi:NAD-dependent SIR2 family protein deacetylase
MQHIHCAACGAELVENRTLQPDRRPPCPACGSTARRFSVELSDMARASDSLTVAVIRPASMESAQAFGTPVVAHVEPAMATVTAHDATAEAEDGQTAVDVEEALVEQGFQLWWQQLTASPVTWMAQVYDAAGEEIASGVGDNPVEILAGLADRLLPHHPG